MDEGLKMMDNNLDDLKAEFDKFVRESCVTEEEKQVKAQEEEDEDNPAFVEELADKLLGPAHAGVYLSRLDIKRIAEAIEIKDNNELGEVTFVTLFNPYTGLFAEII